MDRETEGRILNINTDEIRVRLEEIGAELVFEETLFETIVFEHPKILFDKQGVCLRLRRRIGKEDGVLTHKGPKTRDGSLKWSEERETSVGDFETMREILSQLGFIALAHREHRREEWGYGGCKIEIDTYPGVPSYIEIEGPEKKMYSLVQLLGFKEEDLLSIGIRKLLERYLPGIDPQIITHLKFSE